MENVLLGLLSELFDEIVAEEAKLIGSQEIEVGMQYIKVGAGCKESSECKCGCASKIMWLLKSS